MKKNLTNKQRRHFAENYIINPTHQVTVAVVGCGGTGSQVLSCLARMNQGLMSLGHPGLHVIAYDDDIVTHANIGRQLFSETEIGLNKAIALVTRINRFYGTAWKAIDKKYDSKNHSNIIITCVDNVKSRLEISKYLTTLRSHFYPPFIQPYYWLDFGNTVNSGQVILGTVTDIKQPTSEQTETVASLPLVTKRFSLQKVKEEDSGPSCSLAEAISKQDMFINSTLAQLGCNLLWKLFREGMVDYSGLYLNLQTMNVNPIPV
ncbi:PRTRC genetic system ThiF family protein [Dysgonomonas hofstadii]|uniref:PRTRC genetic system ThiF family protein n=1 Tax=Dysgonomonas hofstadii TaxID=637886 RepID=A0A840CR19_9BACT|nr:PRTRC system ThiF family protein [Dysgonomonas hofstadii]MBB4036588.1 PRTRC genetic system ThiF family protein [Dysgonomonas hofstadii]